MYGETEDDSTGLGKLLWGANELAGAKGETEDDSTGLGKLLWGVDELTGEKGETEETSRGLGKLLFGLGELKDGTSEFVDKTSDLDGEVRDKIDEIIAEKTGEDAVVTSFTDPRNTDVDMVQFVITTRSITAPEVATPTEETEKEMTLLDRVKSLFHH